MHNKRDKCKSGNSYDEEEDTAVVMMMVVVAMMVKEQYDQKGNNGDRGETRDRV